LDYRTGGTPNPEEDRINDKAIYNVQRIFNQLRQAQGDICGPKPTTAVSPSFETDTEETEKIHLVRFRGGELHLIISPSVPSTTKLRTLRDIRLNSD
jgi:hypothetical protein